MVGVSLPFDWILNKTTNEGEFEPFILTLKEMGVCSVELRTVKPNYSPSVVLQAMNTLWDYGFNVTVHGTLKSAETAVQDLFAPLEYCLKGLKQQKLIITVHPIAQGLEQALTLISDHIIKNDYPVKIALENNRLLPTKEEGDSVLLVANAVENVNRENVGVCFDFGHFEYFIKKHGHLDGAQFLLKTFCKRIIHTHIHAVNGLVTHHPLGYYELQIENYLQRFSGAYNGIYNLELDFNRFKGEHGVLDALKTSITYLNKKLPKRVEVLDRTRLEFDKVFLTAVNSASSCESGGVFSLIHSTSYLFGTDGYFWGVDIAFRNAYELAKTPNQAREVLKELKLLVLTHEHRDHFEVATLVELAKNDTLFLAPHFLVDRLLGLGVKESKIIVANANEEIEVGPLRILPFESYHFRPNGGSGVLEYGYRVSANSMPSMVFPGDIRDFDAIKTQNVPIADVVFAHVWLGDESIDEKSWEPYLNDFASFMLRFKPKTVFVTHLYENGRPDDRMWRIEHAKEVEKRIKLLDDSVNVIIPDWGSSYKL